jgi:hypothetical protein
VDDNQQQIIDILRQQVQAEHRKAQAIEEQNLLAKESLRIAEKARQAEAIRNRMWLQISEDTANFIQKIPQFELILHGLSDKLEKLEEIEERLSRLELGLLLLLGKGEPSKVRALVKDIEQDHKQELLYRYYRRLQKLREQAALYGLATPAEIKIDIEDVEQKVKELEEELGT